MKSATAVTFELDDITAATDELVSQIRNKLELKKNKVAILYTQPETEITALTTSIRKALGCDVFGGTVGTAITMTCDGVQELGTVLHVLTDDNCLFAAAISDSSDVGTKAATLGTYNKAYKNLKSQDINAEPKLIICVTSIVQAYSSDGVISDICNASGGLPIIGYVAGDDTEFCKQQAYLNEESGGDRLALLLISGDIRPIFHTENLTGEQLLDKHIITKSYDNVICEIDHMPAYDYIKTFPFVGDRAKVLWHYQFFVELNNESNDDGIPVSRVLNTYDKETGEVMCFADVPQNSRFGLRYCEDTDVIKSCRTALHSFLDKLENANKNSGDGYEYSTVLLASCFLRNIFLLDRKNAEGELVKEIIPDYLAVSGAYAYGEIAPTSVKDGKAVNRFHNATFTICAF